MLPQHPSVSARIKSKQRLIPKIHPICWPRWIIIADPQFRVSSQFVILLKKLRQIKWPVIGSSILVMPRPVEQANVPTFFYRASHWKLTTQCVSSWQAGTVVYQRLLSGYINCPKPYQECCILYQISGRVDPFFMFICLTRKQFARYLFYKWHFSCQQ